MGSFFYMAERTWIIPDVHGCLLTLKALVEDLIGLNTADKLIFLGDLIDRGPDSRGVLDYIMNLQYQGYDVTVLKGNHEDYMLKVIEAEKSKSSFAQFFKKPSSALREWRLHGGTETLQNFTDSNPLLIPEKYSYWMQQLPLYLQTDAYYIVHAGFNFKNEDFLSDTRAMMWIREFEADVLRLEGKRIIHGHVPVQLDFIHQCVSSKSFLFIDLDNGVYMAGKPGYGNLVALHLESMELLVQPNID